MFGKKILSIIGLLFVAGSVKADNALTSTCEPTSGQVSDCNSYYCINNKGEIYSMGASCNSVQLEKGVYVFDVKTQASDVVNISNLAAYATPDSSGTNLALYSCDSEKICRPLKGYVQLGTAYYKVITGTSSVGVGELTSVTTCESNVGKLGNLDPTVDPNARRKRADVDVICIDGDNTHAIPLSGANGNSYLVDTTTEFGSSSKLVAKFSSDGKIITVIEVDGTSNYLIHQESNDVIYDSSTDDVNTDYMNYLRNYCVDDNMVVRLRKEELCATDRAGDCTYYDCDGDNCAPQNVNYAINEERATGQCVLKENSPSCVNGYYVITTVEYNNGNGETWTPVTEPEVSDGTYVLIECTGEDEGKDCHTVTGSNVPIGYLKNVAQDSSAAPYIECLSTNACKPVAGTAVSGDNRISGLNNNSKYIISIDSVGLLDIASSSSTYVVVEKKDDNIKVIKSGSGYYTTTNSQSVINTSGTSDLYTCTDGDVYTTCSLISNASDYPIGYVKNAGIEGNTYIKCTITACAPYTLIASTNCDSDHYGDLYDASTDVITLCGVEDATTSGSNLILSGVGQVTDGENYMASVATGKGLFGITPKDNYHVVLQFQDGNVTVEKKTADSIRYRYTVKGKTNIRSRSKAVEENDANTKVCYRSDGSNADEYILHNWDNNTSLTAGIAYYADESYTKSSN